LRQEAADWVLRREVGLTTGEAAQFQAWLEADASHRFALEEAVRTWQTLNQPRERGDTAELERELDRLQFQRGRQKKKRVFGVVTLAAALVALGVLLPFSSVDPVPPVTMAVRPDRQILPDGSVVELKSGAEIAVSFSPERRAVQLLQGEALFMVTKDAARPFVVSAGAVEVRAVGTAFSVSHDSSAVAVLVTEGRVAVARTAPHRSPAATATELTPAYLGAGERVRIPVDLPQTAPLAIVPVTPVQVAANLAWRGQRVEFTGTPLAEAVQLFNRQNALQISIGDTAIGRLQITGMFWADDPEGFVRLLETGMSVRVERRPGAVALRSR
jgi:transmembrane sensor